MSQSPRETSTREQVDAYQAGWEALNEMLSRGASLSGRERNAVFLNCGVGGNDAGAGLRFAKVSALTGADFEDDARGLALVDWDHDGDLDLWTNNRTSPRLRFLLNQSPNKPSVSVRLQGDGKRSNRDGIGARVTLVVKNQPPLVRTLAAGHGYLSQSSKCLHFGLGTEGAVIEDVRVAWPGGKEESFGRITAGKTYLLVQHRGEPVEWRREGEATIPESASEAPLVALTEGAAQVLLPRRIPTPRLEYELMPPEGAAAGELEPIAKGRGPLLLMLYASWCPNCAAELAAMASIRVRLKAAGLEVLVLSVDRLQMGSASEANNADRELLARLGVPFEAGRATADLLAKLKHLESALFELHPAFAVPYSFLFDADRELVAIYRGAAPADTLLHDAALTRKPDAVLRDEAIPFPGRWYTRHPERVALLELLADHFRGPFPEEALRYLEKAMPLVKGTEAADQVSGRVAGLHYKLGSQALSEERFDEAERHFRSTLKLRPHYAAAHHDLGAALFSRGRLEEAEACFLRTLELSPNNPRAQHNLSVVHKEMMRLQ